MCGELVCPKAEVADSSEEEEISNFATARLVDQMCGLQEQQALLQHWPDEGPMFQKRLNDVCDVGCAIQADLPVSEEYRI